MTRTGEIWVTLDTQEDISIVVEADIIIVGLHGFLNPFNRCSLAICIDAPRNGLTRQCLLVLHGLL